MKVKCIDNRMLEKTVTIGKIYEVLGVNRDLYTICDDTGEERIINSFRFSVTNEEKVKVGDFVKTKKQHLHGREVIFEVGRILNDENTKEVFLVPSGACPINYIEQSEVSIVRKRTVEEITNEIKQLESCEFEFGEANFHIVQESDGFYKVESRYNEKSLTTIYMTRKTAEMYVDELNLAKRLEWIEKETQ